MRRKEPWFKFYSTDYLCDDRVDALPLEAQGLLVRMWCVCNQRGSIPDDQGEIARLTQCKLQDVLRCYSLCREFFHSRDGRLRPSRMEAEKARSEIARTNAAKRYQKEACQSRTANGTAKSTAQKVRDPENPESESEKTLPLNDKSEFPIHEQQVTGRFGGKGEPTENITYRASVKAQGSEREVLDLMRYTDTVGEIHNALRNL